jgi:ribosome-binding protein aMBF1 (putative translation factor)
VLENWGRLWRIGKIFKFKEDRKMMKCSYCGKGEEEVRLIDAIASGEIVKVCEDCCKKEEMPVISRPTRDQLRESEKKNNVYNRLKRISGYKEKDEISEKAEEITNPKVDRKVEEETEEEAGNLVENFHWKILMARKKKRMTRKELARELGESETVIRMIENKKFPKDSLILIKKLEQYFGIKLREDTEEERERRRLELKEKVDRLRRRQEEEREKLEEEGRIKRQIKSGKKEKKNQEKISGGGEERRLKELKFDRKFLNNITIDDLRRMKKKRDRKEENEEAEKLIKEVEEDSKKKERERIRKAREMLKNKAEKETKKSQLEKLDNGGSEGGLLGEIELEE